jgi:hypothetical protein
VFGHRHATITTWQTRAGMHSATLHDRTFRHLHLPHREFDELRTRLRGRAHTLWLWVAVDPLSKIMVVLRLGPRTQDAAPRGPRSVQTSPNDHGSPSFLVHSDESHPPDGAEAQQTQRYSPSRQSKQRVCVIPSP